MKSITIIDDNHIDAALISSWLTSDCYHLSNLFNSGVDAIKHINEITSDFCIIDVRMPILDGFDTGTLLLEKEYKGKILIVSHAYNKDYLTCSQKSGANAYCRKAKEAILSTLDKLIESSNCFICSDYEHWENVTVEKNLQAKDIDKRVFLLNPVQKKILLYSAKGYTASEIGIKMNFKKHTIDQYRCDMLQQLGFKNITQAVAWALANHIINHSEVITQ